MVMTSTMLTLMLGPVATSGLWMKSNLMLSIVLESEMKAWLIQSNASVHGIKYAAELEAKKGTNIDIVLYVLFGKYHSRKSS